MVEWPHILVSAVTCALLLMLGLGECSAIAPAFMDYCLRQSNGTQGRVPMLLGHNAKAFDTRYILKDFALEGVAIPGDWHFFDTLVLARSRLQLDGNSQVSPWTGSDVSSV